MVGVTNLSAAVVKVTPPKTLVLDGLGVVAEARGGGVQLARPPIERREVKLA